MFPPCLVEEIMNFAGKYLETLNRKKGKMSSSFNKLGSN